MLTEVAVKSGALECIRCGKIIVVFEKGHQLVKTLVSRLTGYTRFNFSAGIRSRFYHG